MSTNERLMEIIDGDNKFDLFAQLFSIGDRPRKKLLYLTVTHPTLKAGGKTPKAKIGVLISGIQAEDGSGDCWIIDGYVPQHELVKYPWLLQEFELASECGGTFNGFFRTDTRKGFFRAGLRR